MAIIGDDAGALRKTLHGLAMPGAFESAVADEKHLDASPLLNGKTAMGGRATAYVCIGPLCSLPVTTPEAFETLLREQRRAAAT